MFSIFKRKKKKENLPIEPQATPVKQHEHSIVKVKLHDEIWDRMTDNDDLGDEDTIIIVSYCEECGKIISLQRTNYMEKMSYSDDIARFARTTGINPRTVTMWKEHKPLKDFRRAYTL